MKRKFKLIEGERKVLSAVSSFHVYHVECSPKGSKRFWAISTGYCYKCGLPLFVRDTCQDQEEMNLNPSFA